MSMEIINIEPESIFKSIKERLGGVEVYSDSFDSDIVSAINNAFATLHQLGIDDFDGNPIYIYNDSQKWSDVLDIKRYGWIKDYVYFKVRLVFDPPSNSSVLNSMQSQLDELTWRIEVERDFNLKTNV